MRIPARGVVLDLDGTLVDSVYHHVLAWDEALRTHGHEVPLWRIHAAIGMGSDRLVPHLLGANIDGADTLADRHTERFLAVADTLRPTVGARALLADLEHRSVPYIVATSAAGEEADALLAALGADPPRVDSDDVQRSKPAPDLLEAALAALDLEAQDAIMVGDSPWDAEAASRIGVRPIGVRCGGFSDPVLRGRGAVSVVDDPGALIGAL